LVAGARLIRSRHAFCPPIACHGIAIRQSISDAMVKAIAPCILAGNAEERHARDHRRDVCCRQDRRVLPRPRPYGRLCWRRILSRRILGGADRGSAVRTYCGGFRWCGGAPSELLPGGCFAKVFPRICRIYMPNTPRAVKPTCWLRDLPVSMLRSLIHAHDFDPTRRTGKWKEAERQPALPHGTWHGL
jgi:hypothetical protein